MLGLAMEGGGARGAYHIGVAKAYLENGYQFDGFVGTSIGSINAALLAQGDFNELMHLWHSISMNALFEAEEEQLIQMNKIKFNSTTLRQLGTMLKKTLDGGGIDTGKMRALISGYIDEQKVRASGKGFGLVTVSVNERKPYHLWLDDIPEGQLIPYVMASACFPGFQLEVIEEKPFIDGGFYDNCPTKLLLDKGYDHIIVARTLSPGIYHKPPQTDATITVITPSEDLGHLMVFDHARIAHNIKMGYYDALRAILPLEGQHYYIQKKDQVDFTSIIFDLTEEDLVPVGDALALPTLPPVRMLLEQAVPQIGALLKLNEDFTYHEFVLGLLEYGAAQNSMERYRLYDPLRFLAALQRHPPEWTLEKTAHLIAPVSPAGKAALAAQRLLKALLTNNGGSIK